MVQLLLVVSETERNQTINQIRNILSGEIYVDLPRLTPEQNGIYTCVVENPIGKVNQSIYLDVQCKFNQ